MTTEIPNPESTIDFILDLLAQQDAREYMHETVTDYWDTLESLLQK